MPRDGSGTYNRYTPGTPYVNNTTIDETVVNAEMSDIATALTSSIAKNGETVPTANIPMGNFKLTGLAAGTTNGDAIRWQQSAAGVMTTLGDTIYASAANTPARLAAAATVAAHATTMDLWTASQVTLSGVAVTVTDIADAPYAGAVVWVKQNAAHVWTHGGGVFDIQGAANYTAASGDWIRIEALSVSTFAVTIFKANGDSAVEEEGTWTPTITFGGGATGITYGTQSGKYRRSRNGVMISGIVALTNKGSSTGAAKVQGLPFAVGGFAACPVRINSLSAALAGDMESIYSNGSTTIDLQYLPAASASVADVADTHFSNTTDVVVGGNYFK